MTTSKYADSCFLSKAEDKRSKNSPDYYGKVEISEETIRHLASTFKEGAPPILRVALWRKENDRGVYLSMQLSVPQEQEGRKASRGSSLRRTETRRVEPKQEFSGDLDDEIPF